MVSLHPPAQPTNLPIVERRYPKAPLTNPIHRHKRILVTRLDQSEQPLHNRGREPVPLKVDKRRLLCALREPYQRGPLRVENQVVRKQSCRSSQPRPYV